MPFINQFLSARFQQIPLNLSQLRAPDVTDFVRRQAHKLSPGRAQLLVTALRSFLRYLLHQGKVTTDLAVCVPTVARWSFASLPKFLPAGSVQKVLDRNDRRTPVGKRNYAILLLLARLGLRACEIVALDLEDIDWENARITIRAKGGRWCRYRHDCRRRLMSETVNTDLQTTEGGELFVEARHQAFATDPQHVMPVIEFFQHAVEFAAQPLVLAHAGEVFLAEAFLLHVGVGPLQGNAMVADHRPASARRRSRCRS